MLGLECMVIDKAILAQSGNQTALASNKEWVSPEWAPWTLLSGGIIVVLYSFVTVHQHHPRPQGGAAGTNERHARRRGAAA